MANQQTQTKEQSSDSTFTAREIAPRTKPLTLVTGGGEWTNVYIAYCRRWNFQDERVSEAIAAVAGRLPGYTGESYSICAYAYNPAKEQEVEEAYHEWQARAWEVDKFHRELEVKHGRTIQYNELAKLLPKHLRNVALDESGREKDPSWVKLTNSLINGVFHVTQSDPLPVMPEDGVPYKVTFAQHPNDASRLTLKRVESMPPKEGKRIVFKSRIHAPGESASNFLGDEGSEGEDQE